MRLLNAVFVIMLLGGGSVLGAGKCRRPPSADRATAYYHYTLGHMYAELAGNTTSRNDYVNLAIENYKAAIKADPNSALMAEELSDLYSQSGRMRDGQTDAEQAIKANPNDLAAHRVLARIYVRQIDAQRGRVNETMVRQATQEYQKITELAPKDADSWVWLGRLQSASQNMDEAEARIPQGAGGGTGQRRWPHRPGYGSGHQGRRRGCGRSAEARLGKKSQRRQPQAGWRTPTSR